MKTKTLTKAGAIVISVLLFATCRKDETNLTDNSLSATGDAVSDLKKASTGITGIGFYAQADECKATGESADYILKMTGDIEGCIYTYIDKSECVNGYYYEEGREHFVGTYKGKDGSFWTNYKSLGKYEGCSGGSPTGAEILGFCEHPIVKGSGEGVFKGVTGRYYMIDKVKAVKFPYEGQLRF
ncbi:MAG TPA: hypothetical protein VH396_21070 [Chitinophagaceae bacterium]|jgi:hypothetical protein